MIGVSTIGGIAGAGITETAEGDMIGGVGETTWLSDEMIGGMRDGAAEMSAGIIPGASWE
jgi:hypothetical protein